MVPHKLFGEKTSLSARVRLLVGTIETESSTEIHLCKEASKGERLAIHNILVFWGPPVEASL